MSRALSDLLLKDKIISTKMHAAAKDHSRGGRNSMVRYMIQEKYITENKLLYYLSQKYGLPSINLDKFDIKPEVIQLVKVDLVRRLQAIPIQANQGTVVVAVCDPTNLTELQNLKFQLKMNVEAVLTSYSAFDRAMTKHYGGAAFVGQAIESFKREERKKTTGKGKEETTGTDMTLELVQIHQIEAGSTENDAPVITFVNGVLSEGIRLGASDIHVEPYENIARVRYRVDGKLQIGTSIPMEMKRAVTARLKIMSRLDIAETRLPQDGRIKLNAGGREIDFRVNTLPTLFGEKVVMRMLDKSALQLDLKKLGFEEGQLKVFKKGIYAPNGMVLVTGPTGSGKTTTLYSSLTELNKVSENLSTVEDPVEYNLEGINQVQVHKEIGLTFAGTLRALLRQDPDIVLVGEIRDYETAEVAIQAALTGHLVLSTLHTNDAPSTITRLMNMGVEPFLVTASLNTVVAQRLVRKICKKCVAEHPIAPEVLVKMGIPKNMVKGFKPKKGKGCHECGHSGYKGRIAIYEIFNFSSNLKEMVLRGATSMEVKKQAVEEGMKPLRHSAINKAYEGLTTVEEALTKTMEN